jgi:putative hemolysin
MVGSSERNVRKRLVMLPELALILVLVAVNGLFAGAELAIVGVDRLRLRELVNQRRRGARLVEALRAKPERFLATVQIGITVAGSAAGAFGGATFAEELEPLLVSFLGKHAQGASIAVVVVLVSYLSLVLGELVPKSLALRHTERYALLVAPLLNGLATVARPLVWLLTKSSNLVIGPKGDKANFADGRLSPAELSELVDEATEAGALDQHVGEIASRALGFAKLTVAQLMIPRTRIVGIQRTADTDELRRIVLEHAHSRLPVYESSLDEITGYVLYKDLLPLAWEGRLIVLQDVIRPPYFVTKAMPAAELLEEMRKRRQQLAIVLDEYGGTAGIVTLDDLFEELTGEVLSELRHAPPLSMHPQPDGSFIVRGDTPLHEVNRELALELAGGAHTTIGGLCLFLAGGMPHRGEILDAGGGIRLHVERASQRTVDEVRILMRRSKVSTPDGSL